MENDKRNTIEEMFIKYAKKSLLIREIAISST